METALRKFCGRKRPGIVSVSSDRAPEILSALSRLGFNAEPAEPNQPLHNPIAESSVRTLKGMTSSLLLQAGFPHEHWPLAHKFIEWIHPVTAIANNEESKTCFEKHHGYVFEGFKLPFGSLVWVKNHDALPFDPKGEPALFLGAELIDGQRFKGLYRVWPLSMFNQGLLRERVVRTLAVPPGPWQFPAKIGSAINQPSSDQPGYLGPEKTRESVNAEFDRFHREMEERNEHFFGMDSKDSKEPLKPTSPARGAGSGAEGGSNGKERNRAITKLLIAVHGPTKHCQACKDFTYSHTKACQARFNSLLDRLEPKIIPKLPEGKREGYESENSGYAPTSAEEEEDLNILGMISHTQGAQMIKESCQLEKGREVVAGILIEAIESGYDEGEMSRKLASMCRDGGVTTRPKVQAKAEWFVEFCCSPLSSCCQVSHQLEVSYLGLSVDFGDLLDDGVMEQVEYWFHERVQHEESIHLFGSIPCDPLSFNWDINLPCRRKPYPEDLQCGQKQSLKWIERFMVPARIALLSGGSALFKWPKDSPGWRETVVLSMIEEFDMYVSFPTGCGFGLEIDGKRPLRPWRVVSTSRRLANELSKYSCHHDPGHKHDEIMSGTAEASGCDNLKMATVIVSSLCLKTIMNSVPAMPTVGGLMAHEERGLWMARKPLR